MISISKAEHLPSKQRPGGNRKWPIEITQFPNGFRLKSIINNYIIIKCHTIKIWLRYLTG